MSARIYMRGYALVVRLAEHDTENGRRSEG